MLILTPYYNPQFVYNRNNLTGPIEHILPTVVSSDTSSTPIIDTTEVCSPTRVASQCKSIRGGHYYDGNLSCTMSGLQCQMWSKYSHLVKEENFPGGNITKAVNYCRNPLKWFPKGHGV